MQPTRNPIHVLSGLGAVAPERAAAKETRVAAPKAILNTHAAEALKRSRRGRRYSTQKAESQNRRERGTNRSIAARHTFARQTNPLNGQHRGPTGLATPTRAATLSGRLAAALRNGSPRSVLDEPVDQPRALPPESLLHGVIPVEMWTSKLGTNYSLDDVRKNDKKSQAELQRIRWRPDNAKCADCAATPTVWAIVNHGTFVCLRCASVHRSLGTHISKPKGCTGTYLWGPDELDAMRPGNRVANRVLGCDPPRLTPDVSDAALREHLIDKYEKRRWAPPSQPPEPPDLMTFDDEELPPPPEEDFFASFGV